LPAERGSVFRKRSANHDWTDSQYTLQLSMTRVCVSPGFVAR
jgi:hypothetical protein